MAITGGGQNPLITECINTYIPSTKVRYPRAEVSIIYVDNADETEIPDLEIWNSKTIIDGEATPSASGVDRAINLFKDLEINSLINGDELFLMNKSLGTETTTYTGIVEDDVVLGGTADKVERITLEFVNGVFVVKSNQVIA